MKVNWKEVNHGLERLDHVSVLPLPVRQQDHHKARRDPLQQVRQDDAGLSALRHPGQSAGPWVPWCWQLDEPTGHKECLLNRAIVVT